MEMGVSMKLLVNVFN